MVIYLRNPVEILSPQGGFFTLKIPSYNSYHIRYQKKIKSFLGGQISLKILNHTFF
jgi:hypothetical protein